MTDQQTWHFEIGAEAEELEQFLHQELKKYRVLNENWITARASNGATEFFSEDVLHLDAIS